MPNLENLKKQAKLVLRWHRDRYYPVAVPAQNELRLLPEILEVRHGRATIEVS